MTPRLTLLGPPVWHQADRALRFVAERPFQLMALLAYEGDWVPRDRLAALFWPGLDADASRRNLRKVLYRLRELQQLPLPDEQRGALRWAVPTDLQELRAQAARGELAAVAAAWQRQPFEGLDTPGGFGDWVALERRGLRDSWRSLLLAHCDASEGAEPGLAWARLLRAHDPFDEEALRAELRALLRAARDGEARQVYQAFEALLATELSTRPEAATRALIAADVPPRPAAPAALPPPAAPGPHLIGRQAERRALLQALAEPGARCVTVLGPGGIGKSSLARAAMAGLPLVAHWLPLHGLGLADELPPRLALALGLGASAHGWEGLGHALAPRREVFVLDGAEAVQGLAPALRALLQAAPGLVLLVTSRERLGLTDERVLVLGGLPCPEPEDDARAPDFDAARLFLHAAHRATGLALSAADGEKLGALCRAVGGWPLALELCAGWTTHLGVGEILRDLSEGPAEVLDPPGPGEARSLQGILRAGWQKLDEGLRACAARLSVLDGPCSTEIARAVTGGSLQQLAALADRAWLQREADPEGAPAWHQHALLRLHLRQRLAERPDWADAARDALAATMARRCARFPAGSEASARELALAELRPDVDALRQAWRASVDAGRTDRLQLMLEPLLAHCVEQHAWAIGTADLMRAMPLLQGRGRAHVQAALAQLRMSAGDLAAAAPLARDALRALRQGPVDDSQLRALVVLGQSLLRSARWGAAARVLTEGRRRARDAGFGRVEAQMLDLLSGVAYAHGDHVSQVALLEEAIALSLQHGLPPLISLSNLGNAWRSRKQLDLAQAAFERGLALARGARWRRERGTLLLNLGLMLGERNGPGDRERAGRCAREGLDAVGDGVDPRMELYLQGLQAEVWLSHRDVERAQPLLRQALASARRLGNRHAMHWLLLAWVVGLQVRDRHAEALSLLQALMAEPDLPDPDMQRARGLLQSCEAASVPAAPVLAGGIPAWIDRILAGF